MMFLLGACSTTPIKDYQNESPKLDLTQYFNGTLDAVGMFQDRSGKVIKRFHVVIDAKWVGEVGTLDEHFIWSDGTKSQRVWTLRKTDAHHFTGTAADVVGEAKGETYGNALQWRYVLALPVDGKVYNVNVDDWMYMIDDTQVLNRSTVSKFGIHFGDITLYFKKRAP
jgi:hypothetical protein